MGGHRAHNHTHLAFKQTDPVLETVEVAAGLKKEILKRGAEGGAKPAQGQTVKAHYTGKLLSGAVFDSSRKRARPFEFPIGVGAVISGWDLGIASMLPGERAVLTCSPAHAYGASGAPPDIPPNSTLAFDVELLGAEGSGGGGGGCALA